MLNKKIYFLNAHIIDPCNSINEVGGIIINENGKIEASGKRVNKNNIPAREKFIDCRKYNIFVATFIKVLSYSDYIFSKANSLCLFFCSIFFVIPCHAFILLTCMYLCIKYNNAALNTTSDTTHIICSKSYIASVIIISFYFIFCSLYVS